MRTMTLQQNTEQKKCNTKPETGGGSSASSDGQTILRRNNRGCRSKEFYNWPEQPFDDMDSPLAVQQYIQQLIRRDPSDIDEILRLPEGQDLGAWKTEHLRLFCMQLNRLATRLQDCCQPETCNQMTATEQWIFLCAAHKQPNECPAIDYTRHTLDGAASLLNSNKYFPSRVTIKDSSVAKLGSVCRRVYRIFSHAYYHHFQVFDEFERETFLCKRFSKFVTIYDLMSKENLIVPSDGSKPEDVETGASSTTQAMNVDSSSQPDLAEQDISSQKVQQQESTNSDSGDAKLASQVKVETKGKKSIDEEQGINQTSTVSTPWTPSQASTNTMVKGSSLSNSPKNNTEDIAAKTTDEEAAVNIPSGSSTIARSTAASSKNGLESEA